MGSTASLTPAAPHPRRTLQPGGAAADPGPSTQRARVSAADKTALVGALVLLVLVVAAVATGFRLVIVYSSSMEPAIEAGDVVLVRSVGPAQVEPGDIITFSDPNRDMATITHRVVEVAPSEEPGKFSFVTRGDSNSTEEHWEIPASGSVGLHMRTVPGLGKAVALGRVPAVRFAILVAALLAGSWALWSWTKAPSGRPAPTRSHA